jgi:hypothetical protein
MSVDELRYRDRLPMSPLRLQLESMDDEPAESSFIALVSS